jgi:hypothetical protein
MKIRIVRFDLGEISKALKEVFDGASVPQIYDADGGHWVTGSCTHVLVASEETNREQARVLLERFRDEKGFWGRVLDAAQEVEL